LSDSTDGIQSETEWAITRLFSPAPAFGDFSVPAVAVGHTSADTYPTQHF